MLTFPMSWKESFAFKAINIIAYVLFASSNTYADNGVWHILSVLLFGLIVYQFWPGTAQIDTVLFGMEIPDRITSSRAMHSIVRAEEFDTHLLRCVHYILHGDDSGETAPRQFAHRC